jgi:IgA Peptidase M64
MNRPGSVLSALLALFTPLAAQTDAQKADKELQQAEAMVQKGAFSAAVAAYREIARKWPTTVGGTLAKLRSEPNAFLGRSPLQQGGPPENRIDVFVMGDGYTIDKLNAFCDVARSVPKNFGRDPVFEEYAVYHNYWQAVVVSHEDGIDGFNREYDTALGGYMIKGRDEQAAVDHKAVQVILNQCPEAEGLAVVFVRAGHLGTGGGGVAVIGGREDDTVIHEWGHAFAGLSDEYVDKVHRGTAGTGINVAGTGDPKQVPWRHFIEAGVPGIGVYEGAAGMQRGAWKATTGGCVMDMGRYYCPVCREAVVLAIYRRVDPIDSCKPAAGTELDTKDEPAITLELLRPKTHGLEVRFWVFPAGKEPGALAETPGDRSRRGPLPQIKDNPAHTVTGVQGQLRWLVPLRGREPGKWVVVCRVKDTTKVGRDVFPWVLKDARGVLESERRWTLTVAK